MTVNLAATDQRRVRGVDAALVRRRRRCLQRGRPPRRRPAHRHGLLRPPQDGRLPAPAPVPGAGRRRLRRGRRDGHRRLRPPSRARGRARRRRPRDACRACARFNLRALRRPRRGRPALREGRRSARTTPRRRARSGAFDCIAAPCLDECPVDQQVPRYMAAVREGDLAEAVRITRLDNPLPAILGRVCDHLCEHTCIRTHLDEPLAIRQIKRFIMEQEAARRRPAAAARSRRAAGRPARRDRRRRAGRPRGGGVAGARRRRGHDLRGAPVRRRHGRRGDPRLPPAAGADRPGPGGPRAPRRRDPLRQSASASTSRVAGPARGRVRRHLRRGGRPAGQAPRAAGRGCRGRARRGRPSCAACARAAPPAIGPRVGVVGAGDTAMDCARSARRVGAALVQLVYRRTIDQMPADREEIHALREEGIEVVELARPVGLRVEDGRLAGLVVPPDRVRRHARRRRAQGAARRPGLGVRARRSTP